MKMEVRRYPKMSDITDESDIRHLAWALVVRYYR